MSVFGNYARYYDLLYKDKDYAGETEYVHGLLQRYGTNPQSILELGCGTGKHALLLAEKGYSVTGVDQSEEMLLEARERQKCSPDAKVEFHSGDVRNVRLGRQYDTVISLFHVMSYQVTNNDLLDAFVTAKVHLRPGGIFIFDCWYGPAVLTDRPAVRVKRLEDDEILVTRIAEPVLHPNENIVDVNYTVLIQEKETKAIEELRETHRMRYLFGPETEFLVGSTGMSTVHSEEWMSGNPPGFLSWGVIFVCGSMSSGRS